MSDMIQQGLHGCSREEQYVWPDDPAVQEKLEWFQDQKLALQMHFGLYTLLGSTESWPLSDEDAVWSRKDLPWVTDGDEFRKLYFSMNRSFNPVFFNPDDWADAAARNGFKYLIFTTKHHEGFCLFDSKYSDYKTTAPDCPFHTHEKADIVKHVFEAFRKRGLGIASYFSKPDWHCPWYWAEGQKLPVGHYRHPTYDPKEQPELWETFAQFTKNQILELMSNYGKIDVLWLDGGQVRPQNGQDVHMDEIVAEARKLQPGLLVADRTVGGRNENYITPEQSVPGQAVRVPWESCVTATNHWGFHFEDQYKTPRQMINMLLDVVCRGGNLTVNIGPQPNGLLPAAAIRLMDGMGAWLRANGDAIYGTRVAEITESGKVAFTRKGAERFAMIRLEEGDTLGEQVLLPWPGEVSEITLVDSGAALPFTRTEEGYVVTLPYSLVGANPIAPAFRMK